MRRDASDAQVPLADMVDPGGVPSLLRFEEEDSCTQVTPSRKLLALQEASSPKNHPAVPPSFPSAAPFPSPLSSLPPLSPGCSPTPRVLRPCDLPCADCGPFRARARRRGEAPLATPLCPHMRHCTHTSSSCTHREQEGPLRAVAGVYCTWYTAHIKWFVRVLWYTLQTLSERLACGWSVGTRSGPT